MISEKEAAEEARRIFRTECVCCVMEVIRARTARKDGFEGVARAFRRAALNDMNHARAVLRLLGKQEGHTRENLRRAASAKGKLAGRYMSLAKKTTGPDRKALTGLSAIESGRADRFFGLWEDMDKARIFCFDRPGVWVCRSCGHRCEGCRPPASCPVCGRRQAFFEPEAGQKE